MRLSKFFFSNSIEFNYSGKPGIEYVELDHVLAISKFTTRNGKSDHIVTDFIPEKVIKESTEFETRIWVKHSEKGWGYFVALSDTEWKRPDLSGVCITCDPRFTKVKGWDVFFKSPIGCKHNTSRLLYSNIPTSPSNHGKIDYKIPGNIKLSNDKAVMEAIKLIKFTKGNTDFSEFTHPNIFVAVVLFRLVKSDRKEEKLFLKSVAPTTFLEAAHYTSKCIEEVKKHPEPNFAKIIDHWIQAKIFYGVSFNRDNNKHLFEETKTDWTGGHLPIDTSWAKRVQYSWSSWASDLPELYVPVTHPDSDSLNSISHGHVTVQFWDLNDMDHTRSGHFPLLQPTEYTNLKKAEQSVMVKFQQSWLKN
ncbi:hypothetical protein [Salmon gill poxvirus]